MSMTAAFTQTDLVRAADGRSYERGIGYVDCVHNVEFAVGEITAVVYGGADYKVSLTLDDDGIAGHCSCPYGQEGFFCKHCVAVGLNVLREGSDVRTRQATARIKELDLDGWLASLAREELLELLCEQLAGDRELRRRLELRAASANLDVTAIRARVRDLLDTRHYGRHGYVEYEDAFGYAEQVGEAVAAIDKLIDAGHGHNAMNIAREAVESLVDAYESIDDSSGYVDGAGHELAAVHARACAAACPDPVELGDYLADKLLSPDYILELDLADYTEVLGASGLARVRERISDAWAKNPSGWAEKRLMESLVRAEGDVDALVGVFAADLDERGYGHLRIAHELDAASRGGEALEWAERGLHDARQADPRLVDYVAARYQADGRMADVVDLRRNHFATTRSLVSYRQLREAAERAGVWQVERGPALEALRGDATVAGAASRLAWGAPVWIDALLDDSDIAAAWHAAPGIANDAQWLRMADALASSRPADALAVYLRLIEPLKCHTGDSVYQQVARLLVSARACWQRLDRTQECADYVGALRADQKRKRNLMRTLDQHGL